MKDAWRHFTAEFIGTFALVFIGGGAIITSPLLSQQAAVVNIALAHGLILALMVTATMRISGHLNPAVTAGFLVTRRIEPMMAVVYWIAQFTRRDRRGVRRSRRSTRRRSSPSRGSADSRSRRTST